MGNAILFSVDPLRRISTCNVRQSFIKNMDDGLLLIDYSTEQELNFGCWYSVESDDMSIFVKMSDSKIIRHI